MHKVRLATRGSRKKYHLQTLRDVIHITHKWGRECERLKQITHRDILVKSNPFKSCVSCIELLQLNKKLQSSVIIDVKRVCSKGPGSLSINAFRTLNSAKK